MSDLKTADLADQLNFMRQRVAELEEQTQKLFQQVFLLQQRLSASSLNEKERAEFISHVAHELRTPLTSIKGYVDLVLEGETGPINDLQREFLGVVGLNAEKLSRIIGDLLDVSRLEAGQLDFKPVLTNLQSLVLETCAEVRPQLEAKSVKFEVSADQRMELIASIDRERFSQALRAIIAHAGQITPEGRTVHLTLKPDRTDTQAVITVEDEGPGIPPGDMEKVFTKFYRPDNIVLREGTGPGMGLAIAKTIIDLHEGKVWADNRSADQVGSVITISLPLISRPIADLTSFTQLEKETSPLYAALVISQNPGFGKVMQQSLGKGGFQVIVATDRSELVSETPAWQPELIINNGADPDLLNEEDGRNLAPALRGAAILTLNLSPVEQRVIAAGAQAVLPWPAPDTMILESLEQTVLEEKERNEAKLSEFKQLRNLLLVSPSTDALRSLDRLLREAGYLNVYRATREADALTLARRYRPDWLLIDLPGDADNEDEGPALLEILREDQLLRKTPAIVFLRTEQIAPDPSPDYRPNFVNNLMGSPRRTSTDELKSRRGGTGELRSRRGGTAELRGRSGTGELATRTGGTDDLKGLYYNIVPKPFLQRRLINIALRLAEKR
jgi:signal transduction histidine kinase/CheY-like chemotaxis protein